MKQNTLLIRSKQPISAVLFLGIFALLAIRSWDALTLPILGHEDGRDMFAFYFNNGNPSGILRYYNGYVSILPNAIGWAAMRLPLPISAHVFTLASLVIATLGFYLLSREGHAWLVPEASTRSIIVVTLTVLPLGKDYMVTNLTYSQWSLLFILIVLFTRWPLPSSIGALSAYAVAVVLCATSHHLSILVLPLCVLQFILNRNRSQRLFIVLCTVILLVYQVLGVEHSWSITPSLKSIKWGLKVFLARVPFEVVFGARATTLLTVNAEARYVYAFGLIILGLSAFMVLTSKRKHRDTWTAGGMLLLAFAVVMISTLVRFPEPDTNLIFLQNPYLQRYTYVPKIIFSFLLLWQLVPRVQRALHCQNAISKSALLAACCVYIIALAGSNHFLYQTSETEGRRVQDFISSAYTDLRGAKQGQPYQTWHVLERGESWDIVLKLHNNTGDMNTFDTVIENDE